jgi:ComF family protein
MECLREPPVFKRVLFYGLYEGALMEAIRLLKFSSIKRLARPLGELLAGLELPEADLIVPVPLEKASLKERGFNQTLLIADALSKRCGVPLGTGVLFKIRKTPPQVGLSREERLKNLRGAFRANDLKGKKVILIDDVITTGATCTECSRALYRAGAKEVTAVVLATPPISQK